MSTTHVIPVSRTVYTERTIHIIECASCSIDFGIGDDFMARRRKDNQTFYCPNGHSNWYKPGKSDEQKLREANAREVALKDQLAAAVHDAERVRAQLLRDRHRFANGVCPCCNRSFENVRRHMTTQHPDFDVTVVAKAAKARCSCRRTFDTPHGLAIHQGRARREGWTSAPEWRQHLTVVGGR